MMNRGVLSRQMFAKGGAAFPDLNKDGEITQADILMGRGVEFKQEGGIAGMMQPPAAEQLDPQVVDQMLTAASQTTGDLEGAQDFEQMMNMVRGDDASVGERREELAGVVGPEDAMQTPESVLALVQPVMQIAAVDQGIGELAQQEMQQPMEGPMAQGIMENVAPPEPMGGPPPVNFKDGGLVRRGDNQPVKMMQLGGDPFATTPGRLGELARERFAARENLLGDPEGRLREQKELTQAQMLFDLANTAAAFAAPMQGERAGLSPAERLAMAAQQTKLFPTIGARAQQQLEAKQAIDKERQGLQLAALGSAETALAAEQKAASELEKEELRQAGRISEIELKDKLGSATQMALAKFNLSGKITLQEMQGDQQLALEAARNEGRLSLAEYNAVRKESLEGILQANRVALAQIQGEINFESRFDLQKQAGDIEKQNIELRSQLRKQEKEVDLQNQLQLAGVQQGYEIERMGIGQEQRIALADHNASLAEIADNRNNAFRATESALDRAAKEKLQLNDQEFRKVLEEEARKFAKDEADLDRIIAQSQRDIDNALNQRRVELQEQGIDLDLERLNIQLLSQKVDEEYKLGMLALEEKAQNAIKIGSEAKTAELTFLTDKDRRDAYVNGTLGESETALYEQTLIEYAKPTYTWDGTTYRKNATPTLAPAIQKTLRERDANDLPVPDLPGFSLKEPKKDVDISTVEFDSPEFMQSLLKDGAVNFESAAWDRIPTNTIQSDIDYERATGPGEIPSRIGRSIAEFARELGFGTGPTEDMSELTTAERDIINLREDILLVVNNLAQDRILKATQDAIRANAAGFEPGTFKFDETAAATLAGFKKQLGRAFYEYAKQDPLYNPKAEGQYTTSQVTNARTRASFIRSVLKDVLALEGAYNDYFESIKGSKGSRRDRRKRSDGSTSQEIISNLAGEN